MPYTACEPEAALLNNGEVLITSGGGAAMLYDPAAETFRRTGQPAVSHGRHSITLLRSGQVLVTGGWRCCGSPPFPIDTVEVYDPVTETFSVTDRLIQARFDHTATLLTDGHVLVAGGSSPTSTTWQSLDSAELWIPGSPDSTSTPTPVVRGTPIQPPEGLVARWPGDGNANDIVGSNDGFLGSTTFASGKVNQAFGFDGRGDYVEVANASDLQITASSPSTLDAWIFPTSFPPVEGIPDAARAVPVTAAMDGYYALQYFDANEFFRAHVHTGVNWIYADAPFSLALDTWTHVAQTWDGTTLKIYVNGQLIGSGARSGPPYTDRGHLFIGTIHGHLFAGRIDEVSIYNRALSADEIKAIYDAGSAGMIK